MDVKLARLSLDGIEVGFIDQSPNTPVRLDLVKGFVTLKDLSLDMVKAVPLKELEIQRKGDVPLEAGFALKQGGRLDARGTLILARRSGRLDLKMAGLSLKPFAPYVNQFARLNLHSGAASTRGKLTFEQAKAGMKLNFGGSFAVDDLAITEEETEEAFLGWKKLSSNSLAVRLGPNRLHMNELVALNPFGKVIIFEDKSINLQRVLRSQPSGKPAATDAAKTNPQSADKPAAFPLAGENKFIVNKLRLGERVDSPDAMKLPLDLAIALLEDSNGIIDLDLPVSGSLDDPQFSYGKIIWKAIVNVLTKLVTAPFRALGKLLGVSSALFKLGLDDSRVGVAAPAQKTAKDQLVASKMSLGVGKKPAVEPAPAAESAPAAVTP